MAAFFSWNARRGSRIRSCSDALAPENAPRIEENALGVPSELAWDVVSAVTSGSGGGGCSSPWTFGSVEFKVSRIDDRALFLPSSSSRALKLMTPEMAESAFSFAASAVCTFEFIAFAIEEIAFARAPSIPLTVELTP